MKEFEQFLDERATPESNVWNFLDDVEDSLPERRRVNPADADYQALALHILKEGTPVKDRTGTGTIKKFPTSLKFDLSDDKLPLLTSKKVFTNGVFVELEWFLRGETNVSFLQEKGVHIWNAWADENGELGPIYGKQWRAWGTADGEEIDQLGEVIERIKTNPYSRRHIVSAWNVGKLEQMALPPCHMMYQFDVTPKDEGRDTLNCQMYQRSADLFLGVPFNIASYAALTRMVAQVTDNDPGELTMVFGDTHIYRNHLKQILEQLSRDPYPQPTLELTPDITDIDDFTSDHLKVRDYQHHPKIKAPISV